MGANKHVKIKSLGSKRKSMNKKLTLSIDKSNLNLSSGDSPRLPVKAKHKESEYLDIAQFQNLKELSKTDLAVNVSVNKKTRINNSSSFFLSPKA